MNNSNIKTAVFWVVIICAVVLVYMAVKTGRGAPPRNLTVSDFVTYIQDGKVIRYLKDKTQQKCRTCTFSASGKEYKLLKATTDEDIKKILCK